MKIAKPKADEIFKRHILLPVDNLETRQKRLVYRSKQRGWLEGENHIFNYSQLVIYAFFSTHLLRSRSIAWNLGK